MITHTELVGVVVSVCSHEGTKYENLFYGSLFLCMNAIIMYFHSAVKGNTLFTTKMCHKEQLEYNVVKLSKKVIIDWNSCMPEISLQIIVWTSARIIACWSNIDLYGKSMKLSEEISYI